MECGLQRHERKTWLIKHHLKMMTSLFVGNFKLEGITTPPPTLKAWGQCAEFQFNKLPVSRNLALNTYIPINEPPS